MWPILIHLGSQDQAIQAIVLLSTSLGGSFIVTVH
jgi:hypothetical protein